MLTFRTVVFPCYMTEKYDRKYAWVDRPIMWLLFDHEITCPLMGPVSRGACFKSKLVFELVLWRCYWVYFTNVFFITIKGVFHIWPWFNMTPNDLGIRPIWPILALVHFVHFNTPKLSTKGGIINLKKV